MYKNNFHKVLDTFKKSVKLRDNSDAADLFKEIYEKSILKPEKIVGKPLQIDNKILYPIIKISSIENKSQGFVSAIISPIAIVVKEEEKEFIFSLTDKEINPEELFEMIKK